MSIKVYRNIPLAERKSGTYRVNALHWRRSHFFRQILCESFVTRGAPTLRIYINLSYHRARFEVSTVASYTSFRAELSFSRRLFMAEFFISSRKRSHQKKGCLRTKPCWSFTGFIVSHRAGCRSWFATGSHKRTTLLLNKMRYVDVLQHPTSYTTACIRWNPPPRVYAFSNGNGDSGSLPTSRLGGTTWYTLVSKSFWSLTV